MIRCDNGPAFRANLFKNYCTEMGIKLDLFPSYMPERAGKVEKLNSAVRYSLAKVCDGNYSVWDQYLNRILQGIRARWWPNLSITLLQSGH